MIRRLIGLVFVLFVAGNSLAASALLNDGECIARCCRTAIQSQQIVTSPRIRCYSDCDERGQTTPVLTKGLIGSEYVFKTGATVSTTILPKTEQRSSKREQTSEHHLLRSNNIYLKTGSLLI
jgi:hypothetical protein